MTLTRYSKRNCLNIKTNRAGYASNARHSDYRPACNQCTHKLLQPLQARILFPSDFRDGGSRGIFGL